MSLQELLEDTYGQYLRRLDARALLEFYGAQRTTEQYNHDGTTEIVHSCLIDRVYRHHTNGDANPSASCNIDKKQYVCYSLGAGMDLLRFIKVMEGKAELSDAMPIAANFLSEAVVSTQALQAEVERNLSEGVYTGELPSYDESVLTFWSEGHPYWASRQITEPVVEQLRLGYDPTSRRVVFPHYVEGSLVGWQKRVIPGESVTPEPKYLNSPGFPKSETLYNFDEARQHPRVCVVESPMSVARALSEGLPNVTCTFGAKVSQRQIKLLAEAGFERIYIWFDRDKGGIEGEHKLVRGLYRRTEVLVVTPDRNKDMGDCDLAEMAVYLKRSVPAALRLGGYDVYRRMRR